MTRKRRGLRPLSQTGLPRIPANPRQRPFKEGGGKERAGVLERFNETVDGDRQLHPTKGWRTLSVKRSRAQMVVASIRNGASADLRLIGRFIAHGY